eukprot:1654735-Pyramimonas_sp.AAC.1
MIGVGTRAPCCVRRRVDDARSIAHRGSAGVDACVGQLSTGAEGHLRHWVHLRDERTATSDIGFIFVMYHANTWWYEIADLVRKLILTSLITFVEKGSSVQVPGAPKKQLVIRFCEPQKRFSA